MSIEVRTGRVVHAVCSHDCPDSCGVLVTVNGAGRAVKVQGDPEHPVTRGFLCGKVAKYLDRVYSPERLLYPMRRRAGVPKGPLAQGREAEAFERISWEEALALVAERLGAIAAEFGPESVLPYSYAGTIGQLGFGSMDRRFFHRMGASQLDRTICSSAGGEALMQVYGVKLGTAPEDFARAGMVIAWGANIHGNNVHLWPFIEEARRAGAKLVVIDPYRTRTAALAEEHLAIRPGTDGLLALGIMHVIFREGLEDREYMEACTRGGAELRAHALRVSHAPGEVERVTGIAAAVVERMAREYATCFGRTGKGSVIRLNYGVQRSENGGTAARAVAMLPLVTGGWRHPGGGLQLSTSGAFPFHERALRMPELMWASPLRRAARVVNMSRLGWALTELGRPLGEGDSPISIYRGEAAMDGATVGLGLASPVGEADSSAALSPQRAGALVGDPGLRNDNQGGIGNDRGEGLRSEGPPVKALFVYNSNPAAVAPNGNAVLRGMRRPDLFTVVHEQFFTDTTDYADVLLPAPTFLEVKDVQGAYGHLYAQVSERAIEPLGEARSNVRMFGELARRMGFGETCFDEREDELIDAALRVDPHERDGTGTGRGAWFAGVTRERLEREGHVRLQMPVDECGETLPFSTAAWFRTASGRGELVPVPVFVAPTESRGGAAGEYPLEFLPRKADNYMNSTFANLPGHQRMEAATAGVLEMSLVDAEMRGIRTGDAVEVFNGRGQAQLVARVTVGTAAQVPEGVVAARLDWAKLSAGGANVNALTSERLTDIGGGATFYSTMVEVRQVVTSG
jgi:anaerobic selenocysteine-containing dehydrogenase